MQILNILSGYDGSNPFGSSGFLRLVQDGADTLLQGDQNGGGNSFTTLFRFQNTTATSFTSDNFTPAWPTDGSTPSAQTITGTASGETINGTIGNDIIDALGGDDTVNGDAGADTIYGGAGADTLRGRFGADYIEGGTENDILQGEQGDDTLRGGDGNDSLSGGAGINALYGDAGNDFLDNAGGQSGSTLDGGADNDTLFAVIQLLLPPTVPSLSEATGMTRSTMSVSTPPTLWMPAPATTLCVFTDGQQMASARSPSGADKIRLGSILSPVTQTCITSRLLPTLRRARPATELN